MTRVSITGTPSAPPTLRPPLPSLVLNGLLPRAESTMTSQETKQVDTASSPYARALSNVDATRKRRICRERASEQTSERASKREGAKGGWGWGSGKGARREAHPRVSLQARGGGRAACETWLFRKSPRARSEPILDETRGAAWNAIATPRLDPGSSELGLRDARTSGSAAERSGWTKVQKVWVGGSGTEDSTENSSRMLLLPPTPLPPPSQLPQDLGVAGCRGVANLEIHLEIRHFVG